MARCCSSCRGGACDDGSDDGDCSRGGACDDGGDCGGSIRLGMPVSIVTVTVTLTSPGQSSRGESENAGLGSSAKPERVVEYCPHLSLQVTCHPSITVTFNPS